MDDLYKIAELKQYEYFTPRWRDFFQNPLWYVLVVTCLVGLTGYLRFWWGVTGVVALLWGLWLMWHMFGNKGQSPVVDETQLQGWLNQARDYQVKIKQALDYAKSSRHLFYDPSLPPQLDTWIEVIEALTQRLALLQRDELVIQEITAVPRLIDTLETQLAQTSDATIRAQLEQALTHRRRQQAGLQQLQTAMQQAEIRIENTLSLLSTIYIQLLMGQSVTHTAVSHHFLADVEEEVNRLQDRLEALCEVKSCVTRNPACSGYN